MKHSSTGCLWIPIHVVHLPARAGNYMCTAVYMHVYMYPNSSTTQDLPAGACPAGGVSFGCGRGSESSSSRAPRE